MKCYTPRNAEAVSRDTDGLVIGRFSCISNGIDRQVSHILLRLALNLMYLELSFQGRLILCSRNREACEDKSGWF